MKANVSRGGGFLGVLQYVLDEGPKAENTKKAKLVGGNMSGRSAGELAAEFGQTRKLRPSCKRPVWHCSLALPEGETLTAQQWDKVARAFLRKMKIDPDKHQHVVVRHRDTGHDHVHLVATRIGLDSELWLGKFEQLNAIEATQELEREFGLTVTPGLEELQQDGKRKRRRKPKQAITRGEIQMAARTGETPTRVALQQVIDDALAGEPVGVFAFIDTLAAAGVNVRPNVQKTGRVSGISFEMGGVAFKGSQLGKAYSWGNLIKRGLVYEQAKDGADLKRYAAGNQAQRGEVGKAEPGRAPAVSGVDSRQPESSAGSQPGDTSAKPADIAGDPRGSDLADGVERAGAPAVKGGAQSGSPGSQGRSGQSQEVDARRDAGGSRGEPLELDGDWDGVGSVGWGDAAAHVDDLAASAAAVVAQSDGQTLSPDHQAKIQAWRRQHSGLQSPGYRVTAANQRTNVMINFGKGKGSDGGERIYSAGEVEKMIPELRGHNARGADIYVTPIDPGHHYLLVDDLTTDSKAAFDAAGYQPCLVQESSPGNRQAVLKVSNLGHSEENSVANQVFRGINKRYGDANISAARHPFRMAGFGNKKPKHQVNGKSPFVRVISAAHRLCSKTMKLMEQFRERAVKKLTKPTEPSRSPVTNTNQSAGPGPATDADRELQRLQKKWIGLAKKQGWDQDDSVADYRAARDMLDQGYSRDTVISALERVSYRKHNPHKYATDTLDSIQFGPKSKRNPKPGNEPGPGLG